MARYSIEDTTLTNIANKIRNKTNSAAAIRVKDWEDAIDSINGEAVTEETNAYTTKISQLETAVTALETELAGKASGGGTSFETCVIEIINNIQSASSSKIGYVSVEQNQIITKYIEVSSGTAVSINCLCNSTIGICSLMTVVSPYLQSIIIDSTLRLYKITAAKDTIFSIVLTENNGGTI